MPSLGERETRDVAAKLRITAALLGCAGQRELCAAFRRVNPRTEFDLWRSYKWIQGRSLPRSSQVYEDWIAVCGLDRPGGWLAACTLEEFVAAACARHDVERAALLRRAGLDGGRDRKDARHVGAPPIAVGAEEDYLCGAYACYSHAQSPYYRGRLVRGAMVVERAPRRVEGLVATYSQALFGRRAFATGPAVLSGLALALMLATRSPGAMPIVIHVLVPAPPASLLVGLMGSFTMVDPGGQPPYATRIAMLRTPMTVAALETSNRYLEEPDMTEGLARDLPALGLRAADPEGLAAALARYLIAEDGAGASPGSIRISMEGYVALAMACDRAWLDTLAAPGGRRVPIETRPSVAAAPDDGRRPEGDGGNGAAAPSDRTPGRPLKLVARRHA
jgi:hypothetical protein